MKLRMASLRFGITTGFTDKGHIGNLTGARPQEVIGPMKTTVMLLQDDQTRLCFIMSELDTTLVALNRAVRRAVAEELKIPLSRVLTFASHNHNQPALVDSPSRAYHYESGDPCPASELTSTGKEFVEAVRSHSRLLPARLEPVTVRWAEGLEGRITYNRKGRRANGSTYFMREEDRRLVGKDFNGDIDRQAPLVLFKNATGKPVGGLIQFTGHPVTSYAPEKPIIFGEWSQVATDVVGQHLASSEVPVGFLQGCAGDVNSKEMFSGGVERSVEFGQLLGESYMEALAHLQKSQRDGLDYQVATVHVPLAPLPPRELLQQELQEMNDFIRGAKRGSKDALFCVGLNFPRALSPVYRAALVEAIRPWNEWALALYEEGKEDSVPQYLEMELYVIRISDVAIVGIPGEPFLGIGRQIRHGSPFPITIPCGYVNESHGYITDGPNTGDSEYMSSFYRYTRFRPPFKRPAGDVLAEKAVEILQEFAASA